MKLKSSISNCFDWTRTLIAMQSVARRQQTALYKPESCSQPRRCLSFLSISPLPSPPAPPTGAQREGGGQGGPTVAGAACSDPALLAPAAADGGFQELTCRGRTPASGTMGLRCIFRLDCSLRVRSRQKKKKGIRKRDKRRHSLCLLSPLSALVNIRCNIV